MPRPQLSHEFQIQSVAIKRASRSTDPINPRLENYLEVAEKQVGKQWTEFNHVSVSIPKAPEWWEDDGFLGSAYYLKMEHYNRFKLGLWKAFEALHSVYHDQLPPAEHEATVSKDFDEVELLHEHQRSTYLIAKYKNQSTDIKIASVARVYDGRVRIGEAGPFKLPIERRLEVRKVKTRVFDELRENGHDLLEIGKYFLLEDLEAIEKKHLRLEIFRWLESNFLIPGQLSEKTVFVIDPVSSVHERAYQTFYGARPLDRTAFTPALGIDESIMLVTIAQLRIKIRHILDREDRSSQQSH